MNEQTPSESLVERTTATVTVEAPVERCFAVGIDLAAYPEWVENLQSVEVLTVDDQDRPLTARFEADGLGRHSRYVLGYDLSGAPGILAWHLVSGDLTREIEGRYRFEAIEEPGDDPLTEVSYELTIDLAVPLPGFVKRRAEDKIVTAALKRFKQRIETTPA